MSISLVCTFLFWTIFPQYNSCSPFSYLSKSVEIMWFGFVFMEKNAKNKKKTQHFSKSFTSYLHKGSTLEHDLNRFWKLQFRATTFVFDLFLEFITYWLDPDRYNHHYLLFPHFWVKNYWYFLFWTSTLDPECITQQYWPPVLFVSDFSPILCLFFI